MEPSIEWTTKRRAGEFVPRKVTSLGRTTWIDQGLIAVTRVGHRIGARHWLGDVYLRWMSRRLLNFDPRLPALPRAYDLTAVARLFEESWPGRATTRGAPVAIRSCRLQGATYQPSARCVTTYVLLVERPGQAPWQTIGVIETTPAGLAHRLFNDDPKVPALVSAVDPTEMSGRFASLSERVNCTGAIDDCLIIPISYKPGLQCVFRYVLRSKLGQQVFVGKLLAADGNRLMATITALHRMSQVIPGMPRIPRPLAYWPEMGMLVQPAVGRGNLDTRAFDAAVESTVREQWMREAGVHLAALQACTGIDVPQYTLDNELRELREHAAPMALVSPALTEKFEEAVAEIVALARGQVEPTAVATHGAFRPEHLLIEDGGLVLIDMDGFCRANPARDVGNFLAYLDWKEILRPQFATFIARARNAFIEGYKETGTAIDEHWLAIYHATSLLKIAGRCFYGLTFWDWHMVPHLLDSAVTALHRQERVKRHG